MLHVLLLLLALAASVSMTGAPIFFLLRGFRCEGAKRWKPQTPKRVLNGRDAEEVYIVASGALS